MGALAMYVLAISYVWDVLVQIQYYYMELLNWSKCVSSIHMHVEHIHRSAVIGNTSLVEVLNSLVYTHSFAWRQSSMV